MGALIAIWLLGYEETQDLKPTHLVDGGGGGQWHILRVGSVKINTRTTARVRRIPEEQRVWEMKGPLSVQVADPLNAKP